MMKHSRPKAGIFFNQNLYLMKRSKIVTPFEGQSDPDFKAKADAIYKSMLGNVNFPTPVPELTLIDGMINAFGEAMATAKDRDRNSVARKNDIRQDLTYALIQLASSVTTVANGDKTLLISSGFELAKPGETIPFERPKGILLTDGKNSGELVVKIPTVKGAKSYGAQYTTDPLTASSEWTQEMTTTSKFTFKNLVAAQKYWCRMAAIGPYGQVVYSDAVCRVVQ